ncbi:MAG: NADH-quinone oxidoreductase subunit J [Gammaproteobacteria bacterium]|nr:NADH-quinone oxidoreductase subunit J [Gammaproteobacteria bacterium]
MNLELAIFYFFAAMLVGAATLVVTIRNPVHAALFLVLAFFASAGVWLLLEAEFLAVTLVLVYVGAVMVLFLFVVMMLDINLVPLKEGFARYLPVGALVALVLIVEIALAVGPERFGLEMYTDPVARDADYSNTKELGRVLYTTYVYPFEIAAVILVVAIIAAIAITLREKRQTKYVQPEQQVSVTRKGRVRMVNMPAEKKKK